MDKEITLKLIDCKMLHEWSVAYEPRPSGMIERLDGTLMEGIRALLIGSE